MPKIKRGHEDRQQVAVKCTRTKKMRCDVLVSLMTESLHCRPLAVRRCSDVESTSKTLIQLSYNVVQPESFLHTITVFKYDKAASHVYYLLRGFITTIIRLNYIGMVIFYFIWFDLLDHWMTNCMLVHYLWSVTHHPYHYYYMYVIYLMQELFHYFKRHQQRYRYWIRYTLLCSMCSINL